MGNNSEQIIKKRTECPLFSCYQLHDIGHGQLLLIDYICTKNHYQMKKGLLTYLFLLSALTAFSQSSVYHPFPQCYAAWGQYDWVNGPPQPLYHYNYYLAGDSVINGQTYHKVRWADSAHDSYYAAIREDGNKHIYIWRGTGEELLYDFNLNNVGDHEPSTFVFEGGATVTGIDTVLVGTSYRKEYVLQIGLCGCEAGLIEGIGCDQDLFYVTGSLAGGPALGCFSQNGVKLYGGSCTIYNVDTTKCTPVLPPSDSSAKNGQPITVAPVGITIYPNPASDYVTIEYGMQSGNISQLGSQELIVTDELGQNIRSTYLNSTSNIYTMDLHGLANGVYFVVVISNKKVVAQKKLVVVQPH